MGSVSPIDDVKNTRARIIQELRNSKKFIICSQTFGLGAKRVRNNDDRINRVRINANGQLNHRHRQRLTIQTN